MTALERELLEVLVHAPEPTWIILGENLDLGMDRAGLEGILERFEERGLLKRTLEPGGNPDTEAMEMDHWWALTEAGLRAVAQEMPPRRNDESR